MYCVCTVVYVHLTIKKICLWGRNSSHSNDTSRNICLYRHIISVAICRSSQAHFDPSYPFSPVCPVLYPVVFLISSLSVPCSILSIPSWLVVYLPPRKIWKSVGMMTFPIYGKIESMFQSPPNSKEKQQQNHIPRSELPPLFFATAGEKCHGENPVTGVAGRGNAWKRPPKGHLRWETWGVSSLEGLAILWSFLTVC